MNIRLKLTLLFSIIFIFPLNVMSTPDGQLMEERNRGIARDFYDQLYRADNIKAESYLSSSFTEHQMSAGYTKEGLLSFAANRVKTNPGHYNVVHRSIAQGNRVFIHVEERLSATVSVARGELFRFGKSGKIEEHWSTEQSAVEGDKHQNGFFRGSEVNRSSGAGRKFSAKTMESDAKLFRTLDSSIIFSTRTDRYIQHNPWATNGPEGLQGFIEFMKSNGTQVEVKVIQVIAEGDYVVGLNYFKTTPAVDGFSEVVVFDIVRVNEAGKSDEHWDVIQELNGESIGRVF